MNWLFNRIFEIPENYNIKHNFVRTSRIPLVQHYYRRHLNSLVSRVKYVYTLDILVNLNKAKHS